MIGNIIFGVGLAIWLAPIATGLFDVACWLWAAGQCTSIDWGSRAPVVIAWTVLLPMLFVVVFSA